MRPIEINPQLIIHITIIEGSTTSSSLVQISDQHNICPRDTVVYQCTVCGAGATVWSGSLFACVGDKIILRHHQFRNGSASGECNNGTVIAQSTGVVSTDANSSLSVRDCYSSQLNISTNIDMDNKTVTCLRVDNITETVVDTLTLTFRTGTVFQNIKQCMLILRVAAHDCILLDT